MVYGADYLAGTYLSSDFLNRAPNCLGQPYNLERTIHHHRPVPFSPTRAVLSASRLNWQPIVPRPAHPTSTLHLPFFSP